MLLRILSSGLALLLWGCASTDVPTRSYDAASDRSLFQSPKVLVGNVNMTSGLVGGQRVMMQAFASCEGRVCAPSTVDVAFFNDSSADVNLDYRRIEIVIDGRSLEWEDEGRRHESPWYIVPRGEFIRVPLSQSEFERLASGREVQVIFGLTGTSVLRMPPERREPLREMVAEFGDAQPET